MTFVVRFVTYLYQPPAGYGDVFLRDSVDDWRMVTATRFDQDAWQFELDADRYCDGFEFKFSVGADGWMGGDNLVLEHPSAGDDYAYYDGQVWFPFYIELIADEGAGEVTIRESKDYPGWSVAHTGTYSADRWRFTFDAMQGVDYSNNSLPIFDFKFLLDAHWMRGPNLTIDLPKPGSTHTYSLTDLQF